MCCALLAECRRLIVNNDDVGYVLLSWFMVGGGAAYGGRCSLRGPRWGWILVGRMMYGRPKRVEFLKHASVIISQSHTVLVRRRREG